jgi:zinc D-Ala-D-Ala carboxypeptidase
MGVRRIGLRWVASAVAGGALLSLALALPAQAQDSSTSSPSSTATATPTGSPTATPTTTPTTSPTTGPTSTGSPTSTASPSSTPNGLPTPSVLPPVVRPPTPATPNPANPAAAPVKGDGETPLTPAALAQQLVAAQALQQQLLASNARLAGIEAKLTLLSTQSQAALQSLQTAQQAEQQALSTEAYQQQRLAVLKTQAANLQLQLGRWARNAYVTGGAMARLQAYIAALQADKTDDVGNALFLINFVGESETQALEQAQTLESVQQLVSDQATEAAQAATAARLQAEAASASVQSALVAQRALLLPEQGAQAGRLSQAAYTQAQLARLGGAQATAARAELAAAAAGASTSSASCGKGVTKKSVLGFGNGQIPRSDLCPIWGAPGQLLRADAAAAFDTMSKAYAQQFGQPICVTDSYRSYSQQVALYATKPNLAAVPGTSNHGLGVAVDLCGGIESFGTVQHQWLFIHAPLYGWFHPLWAEPTGSRPEPWHWEFGG